MGLQFVASTPEGELRQGEIISDITRFDFDSSAGAAQPVPLGFCITLNQDCDLLQDYNKRAEGGPGILDHALLAEAQLAAHLKTKTDNDIWRRISQNQDIRYQLFSAVPQADDLQGVGIECLVVDFKTIFSIPTLDLYRQLVSPAKRRCCLPDQYRENFQARFCAYLSRIMLPQPHQYTKPAG